MVGFTVSHSIFLLDLVLSKTPTLPYCLLLLEQILKTLVVALLVAGVIPLLLGLLFELVIVAPLRVPLDQTPLFYPWQVPYVVFAHPLGRALLFI